MNNEQERSQGCAIITGGGTGIGREIAMALAETGRPVAVLGRRIEPLDKTSQDIRAGGGIANPYATDIRHGVQVDGSVSRIIGDFGAVEILVNCAGVPRFATLADLEMSEFDDLMAINFRGAVLTTKAVLPSMLELGTGLIVNISSEVAARGTPTATAYGASKAALNYVTKVWAVELAPHGIRVNTVAPGLTDTEEGVMPSQGMEREPYLEWMAQRIPMGRPGQPTEAAALIRYLASPEAAYITGSIIAIDGGIAAT